MSKVSDFSPNNTSGQFPETDLTASGNKVTSNLAESQANSQTIDSQSTNTKPDDLMSASYLINATRQLKKELTRKLDGNTTINNTKDESDDEKSSRRRNLNSLQAKKISQLSEKKISLKISDSTTTALQALRQGLKEYASKAGLSPQAQEDFVDENIQNFAAQAKSDGQENLLEKPGDFSLLRADSPVAQKLNLTAELPLPQKLGLEGEKLPSQELSLKAEKALSQTSNNNENQLFETEISGSEAHFSVKISRPPELIQTAKSSQTVLSTDGQSEGFGLQDSVAQRATIEARLPIPVKFQREFEILTDAIQRKIEDVLQNLGLGTAEKAPGERKSIANLHQVSEFLDAQKPLDVGDKALFATAFGVATESSSRSRERHGDGVLLEFANYGGEATAAGKEANQLALAKLLQHGTQAGFPALLKSVDTDFSTTELKSVEQLQQKLGADKTSSLVVGVVTMSVMTREVVEQLNHTAANQSLGLSDNALAALQKAHNSLRDHLTPSDVIGAVGDLKNIPVEIGGRNYSFFPEVSEALNSLREARSRILSETVYLRADAGGTDAQQRFVREAENLFGITERIESILGI